MLKIFGILGLVSLAGCSVPKSNEASQPDLGVDRNVEQEAGTLGPEGFAATETASAELQLDLIPPARPGQVNLGICGTPLDAKAEIGRTICSAPEELAGQTEPLLAGEVRQTCSFDADMNRPATLTSPIWASGCREARLVRAALKTIAGASEEGAYNLVISR